MARSWGLGVVLLAVGCQRTDASTTTAPVTSSVVASAAVLTPLSTATPPAASSTGAQPAPLPTLDPVKTTLPRPIAAKSAAPSSKRDPMRACCDALRHQSQPQSAQAAAVCDGVVAALDDTVAAPRLEQLVRPLLVDAPLPEPCKGL
jgi:hypothetical protein